MNQENIKEFARRIINKGKWWDMLSRFIEVLRINIFVVDNHGFVILPPEEGKYGGRLLTNRALGLDLPLNSEKFILGFQTQAQGKFFESLYRYDLHIFALPIDINHQTMAYMIVGPVILAKRLDANEYKELAAKYGVNAGNLIEEISEVRVVSHVMMNSILDLLAEIIRDNVELSLRTGELSRENRGRREVVSKEIREAAQEIYSTVRLDELLVTLLDVALKMTDTECGSIMVIDADQSDSLSIKVSRGLHRERIYNTHVKVGEGIAGLAAQQNECFLIHGQETPNNRIRHLLKRSDIKHSLVMPLVAKDRVFGVLNLHTKKEEDKINENLENLQYLSKLLSSAF